jgi:hypothetical protein
MNNTDRLGQSPLPGSNEARRSPGVNLLSRASNAHGHLFSGAKVDQTAGAVRPHSILEHEHEDEDD